jgi:hypothetical protein
MKKHKNITIFNVSSQENIFLQTDLHIVYSSLIKNLTALVNPFELLFKEKLPIIYANIRV